MSLTPLKIMEDLLSENHPEIADAFVKEYNEGGHWEAYGEHSTEAMNAFIRYKLVSLGDAGYSVRRTLYRSEDIDGWRENICDDVLSAVVSCFM